MGSCAPSFRTERERVDPAAAAQSMAGAAMQGALDVLEREWQDGGMPLHAFMERINLLLDEVIEYAHSRTDMAVAGAGSALVALTVLAVRWRTA
jgi:hypothetical protein